MHDCECRNPLDTVAGQIVGRLAVGGGMGDVVGTVVGVGAAVGLGEGLLALMLQKNLPCC